MFALDPKRILRHTQISPRGRTWNEPDWSTDVEAWI